MTARCSQQVLVRVGRECSKYLRALNLGSIHSAAASPSPRLLRTLEKSYETATYTENDFSTFGPDRADDHLFCPNRDSQFEAGRGYSDHLGRRVQCSQFGNSVPGLLGGSSSNADSKKLRAPLRYSWMCLPWSASTPLPRSKETTPAPPVQPLPRLVFTSECCWTASFTPSRTQLARGLTLITASRPSLRIWVIFLLQRARRAAPPVL